MSMPLHRSKPLSLTACALSQLGLFCYTAIPYSPLNNTAEQLNMLWALHVSTTNKLKWSWLYLDIKSQYIHI